MHGQMLRHAHAALRANAAHPALLPEEDGRVEEVGAECAALGLWISRLAALVGVLELAVKRGRVGRNGRVHGIQRHLKVRTHRAFCAVQLCWTTTRRTAARPPYAGVHGAHASTNSLVYDRTYPAYRRRAEPCTCHGCHTTHTGTDTALLTLGDAQLCS